MPDRIDCIHAHEILDSRGNPTVHVMVTLKSGRTGSASVPSGASTGSHEAFELRDGDARRYNGLGVRKAIAKIHERIAPMLRGTDITDLRGIDDAMRILDGTRNKRTLGANAMLGVSLACAHAAARSEREPLYFILRDLFGLSYKSFTLPTPLLNVFNGGRHADTNLDLQEFLIIPHGFSSFARKLQAGSEIFHALGDVLRADKKDTDVGNEGGYAPDVGKTEQAFDYLMRAIKRAKYKAGKQVSIGVDVAANEFYNARTERYVLSTDRKTLTASRMIDMYADWMSRYPLISLEDGLAEDDWEHWAMLTHRLGDEAMIIGDDLFVTQEERLARGMKEGVANAILIKPNQVGTLTETIDTILLAQKNKYKIVISHRSGETTDTTIADLSVAVNAEFIKSGAPSRSERLAKYNRLLEIEEELAVG